MFHMQSATRVSGDSWLSQLLGGRVPLEMFPTQLHASPQGRGPRTSPEGTNCVGGLSSSSSLRASLEMKLRGSNKASEVSQQLGVRKQSTDCRQKRARHRGRIPPELGLRVILGSLGGSLLRWENQNRAPQNSEEAWAELPALPLTAV